MASTFRSRFGIEGIPVESENVLMLAAARNANRGALGSRSIIIRVAKQARAVV